MAMTSSPPSTAGVVGALAVIVAAGHAGSLFTGRSRTHPAQHVLGVLVLYAVFVPFVFRTSDHWYGAPMQLMVSLTVLALDWLSFHQDLSRFSEGETCLFGNCRFNARVTGHLAHWGDVAGVGFVVVPLLTRPSSRALASTMR